MALFNGALLYPRNVDQDQTWGTSVKQLSGTSAADTSFAITYTSTSAVTHTIKPYVTENASTTDNRTNYGWALNESSTSADSMGSTSTVHRYSQSGTWTLATNVSYTAPALLASYTIVAEYSVYRVATGGGTRTLLFTATSNTLTASLAAGSGTLTATSSQPIIEFQPGETFHVAIRITSAATSAVLGGTTNSVITIETGVAAGITVTLPNLGLKSLYLEDATSSASVLAAVDKLLDKSVTATNILLSDFSKFVRWYRTVTGSIVESTSVNKLLMFGSEANITATSTVDKTIVKVPASASSEIYADRSLTLIKPTYTSSIVAIGDYQKQVIYNRYIDANMPMVSDFIKQVIYVRYAEASVGFNLHARICLDIDDLPDAGTPIVVNKQRFMEWE